MSFTGAYKMKSNQSKMSYKRGFTLIELLVVVLIISILAAVAVPQYQKAVDKTRTMTVISTLKAIQQAQEVYFLTNGTYSGKFDELDVLLPAGELSIKRDNVIVYKDGTRYALVDSSVYGYPNNGLASHVSLEIYYSHASGDVKISCAGYTERGNKICLGFGGKFRTTSHGATYYTLSL